jgi:phosphohistidine phosphatase
MQLLIVRHAIAADQLAWAATGSADDQRPLTDKGRARMKRNAAGIVVALPDLDVIGTSPFLRAAQTATLLARAYGGVEVTEVPALASGGSREGIVDWLSTHDVDARVAVVGHEPDLGWLLAWCLGGDGVPAVAMRKGGACLLGFVGHPAAGRAELKWFLPPSLLRKLVAA